VEAGDEAAADDAYAEGLCLLRHVTDLLEGLGF
jgi:hypothetical protein